MPRIRLINQCFPRDSQTDTNLIQYFTWIGRPEIDKQRYSDLFFCNCNLGYRKDTYSGNMTRNILTNDSLEIKRLIDIIKPDNIISLGLDTSVVVIRTLIDEHFNGSTLTELIGDGKPYRYGDTNVYPMAHPGYWGTVNRCIGSEIRQRAAFV